MEVGRKRRVKFRDYFSSIPWRWVGKEESNLGTILIQFHGGGEEKKSRFRDYFSSISWRLGGKEESNFGTILV